MPLNFSTQLVTPVARFNTNLTIIEILLLWGTSTYFPVETLL